VACSNDAAPRLVALAAQLADDADAQAGQVAARPLADRGDDGRDGRVDRGGVERVVARDHLVQQRGVEHGARARAALVERRRAGDQP
jgi:hypothetical protein